MTPSTSSSAGAFDLFCDLIDADPAQRKERLERLRADDAELAAEVASLLLAHERSQTTFLVEPALAAVREALAFIESDDLSGRVLGRYRLLERIGAGGMGAVYLAERAGAEFEQRVAVKIIRAATFSRDIIDGFRRERQLLANLSHPNIAHLIDGDTVELDDGTLLPFLVMEYVDGEPIDEYCDAHRLSLRARIELFLDVCAAVHHAHQNLVVHRDLKPGNILITRDGVVKLLDFGIAKLMDDPASVPAGAREITMTIERRLTPAYAAPEQVRGRSITTATDVYSLGVVLYELLTGARPYEFDDPSMRAIESAICDRAPLRPTTALTKIGAEIAARRGTDIDRLRRELRGDLEHILLYALRKEPQRRYASAQQFSEDLRRCLAGLTVSARPDTLGYRFNRFVRRNAGAVSIAAALVVALLAGSTTIGVLYLDGRENLRRALTAETLAEDRLEEATQINRVLVEMIESVDPMHARGRDVGVLRELLDETSRRIDDDLVDRPSVEASLRRTIGKTYRNLGLFEEGRAHFERALELAGDGDDLAGIVRADMAALEIGEGNFPEADRLSREAIEMLTTLGNEDEVQEAKHILGQALMHMGRYAEADEIVSEAIERERELNKPPRLAGLLNLRANILGKTDRLEEGEVVLREAIEIHRLARGNDQSNTLVMRSNHAIFLKNLGRVDEAYLASLDLYHEFPRVFGPSHPMTIAFMANHASILEALNDIDEAEALYREVIELQRERLGPDHPDLLSPMNNLAALLQKQRRSEDAITIFRETVDLAVRAYGEGHPVVGITSGGLGGALMNSGDADRLDEAEAHMLRALEIFDAALPPTHPYIQRTLTNLERLYGEDRMNDPQKRAAIRQRLTPREGGQESE